MRSIGPLAEGFFSVFYGKEWLGETTIRPSDLSIAEAYEVQDRVTEMRIDRGEEVVGYKVGCTSPAIREQFGLKDPISGRLFRPNIWNEGIALDWTDYCNCAIEPEMVLRIGKDLEGESLSDDQLIGAIEAVHPGIEVHHIKFWFPPPTLQELIASGGIHAGLVVGNAKASPGKISFADELFSVYKDGEIITQARAAEIMGGPLKSLRWLVDSLAQKGRCLKKALSGFLNGETIE